MRKQLSKGFFIKSVMRNIAEFTRKYLCRNLFFDKVKLCMSATSLKKSLNRSLNKYFAKFVRTPFLQNTNGRLLLIIQQLLYTGRLLLIILYLIV